MAAAAPLSPFQPFQPKEFIQEYKAPEIDFDKPPFDPAQIHAKYAEERQKRIREDGNEQYVNASEHRDYLTNPWEDELVREAVTDHDLDIVVVGGGIASILTVVRLHEAGIKGKQVRVIEKAGDFGGTWYWNRFPGAQCDCESYIYLPLLEEMNYMPSERYARAPEIRAYMSSIGKKYNLTDNALFQTEITEMRWDEDAARWKLTTNRGDDIRPRFVVLCSGPLHKLKLPAVEGIDSFKGHAFHTSRFDWKFTGENLENLKDKRVGIIGTGATAIQAVPYLGEASKELYVFQRTPSSVDIRGNRKTDPNWWNSLKPGWQKKRMVQFQNIVIGEPYEGQDETNDGWCWGAHFMGKAAMAGPPEKMMERLGLANDAWQERLRARVDAIVKDKEVAEKLKPYYYYFCKRPTFNDEYYETFNRPNVTLVDTNGKGIEKITPEGIVANGQLYPLDVIVFSTGFEVGTSYARRCGFEVYGRNGLSLSEKWKDGVISMHGTHTNGFPNCYIVQLPQATITVSNTQGLDEFAMQFVHIVQEVLKKGAKTFEVTKEAEEAWLEECMKHAWGSRDMQAICTPGYYNEEGKLGTASIFFGRNGPYGGLNGSNRYFEALAKHRADGLPGLTIA